MAKRLRKAVAVAALSIFCLPLAACAGVASSDDDGVKSGVHGSGAAYGYVGEAAAPSNEPERVVPTADDEAGDPAVVDPPKSEKYDAYLWDGDLEKAGWNGAVDAPSTYSADSESKTVTIGDAAAFAYFAHQASLVENDGFKGYTVNLECNIDLDNKLWLPVSFASRKTAATESEGKSVMFKGTFDGKGHTVYGFSSAAFREGMTFDGDNAVIRLSDALSVPFPVDADGDVCEYPYGLFATAGNAVFKNFSVVDVSIDLAEKTMGAKKLITDCAGVLVGYAAGDCTLQNITVGSEATDDKIINTACAGGIVGRVYAGKINGKPAGKVEPTGGNKYLAAGYRLGEIRAENCTSYVDLGVDGEGNKKGGIVGYMVYHSASIFDNCVNYGNINGVFAGGITSYFQLAGNVYYYEDAPDAPISYTFTFDNCTNHGNITAKLTNPADGSWIGGIVGAINDYDSDANALYDKTLGFYECFNYGTITTHQLKAAGGIIGRLETSVNANAANKYALELNRVFNYGDVNGYDGDRTGNDIAAGGVIGALINLPTTQKDNIVIAVGNCGVVTGKVADGIIGKGKDKLSTCTVKYLIDAYKPN